MKIVSLDNRPICFINRRPRVIHDGIVKEPYQFAYFESISPEYRAFQPRNRRPIQTVNLIRLEYLYQLQIHKRMRNFGDLAFGMVANDERTRGTISNLTTSRHLMVRLHQLSKSPKAKPVFL